MCLSCAPPPLWHCFWSRSPSSLDSLGKTAATPAHSCGPHAAIRGRLPRREARKQLPRCRRFGFWPCSSLDSLGNAAKTLSDSCSQLAAICGRLPPLAARELRGPWPTFRCGCFCLRSATSLLPELLSGGNCIGQRKADTQFSSSSCSGYGPEATESHLVSSGNAGGHGKHIRAMRDASESLIVGHYLGASRLDPPGPDPSTE